MNSFSRVCDSRPSDYSDRLTNEKQLIAASQKISSEIEDYRRYPEPSIKPLLQSIRPYLDQLNEAFSNLDQ